MSNQPRSIKLFCWILDVSDRSFPVDIDDSQTVGDLKEAIVRKNPNTFVNVDAFLLELRKVSGIFNFCRTTFLTLLQVSILTPPALSNEVVKKEFLEAKPLDEMEPLSDTFPVQPAKKTLHIVVQVPSLGESSQPFASSNHSLFSFPMQTRHRMICPKAFLTCLLTIPTCLLALEIFLVYLSNAIHSQIAITRRLMQRS
jgi:hypothetical protein